MEELIGFVASNSKLSKILAVLDSKGEMDSKTLSKTTRIVNIEKSMEELIEKKLVELKEDKYALTQQGRKVIHMLQGVR